ncbi:HAD family hydrolase [Actinophytocola xinjiangensis]|uniref:HAD family hydrolase n=1 Tax=Actinophytocola xinjiangensis TaxID=485602 RepID=UPI0009FDF3D2|nr:HAD family hydrolase [Actinophytocola xinjiangensis]
MTFGLVPFPTGATSAARRLARAGGISHQPATIHAVCLDIDDTLVDFTATARKALSDMIGRDDMWLKWQRTTDEHVAKVVAGDLAYEDMHEARTKAFMADLGALLDDDLVAVLERRRSTQLRTTWRLFEDTLPCLDWLRAAGLKLAAVTNASGAHQRTKLERLGIGRFFDTVLIAGELGAAKPDPVIFHTACSRMDVDPDQTLHVGDLLEADALGARDAGLHGVWLNRSLDDARPATGIAMIETLADLPELLVTEYRTPTLAVTGPLSGGADFRSARGVV